MIEAAALLALFILLGGLIVLGALAICVRL